MKQLIYLLPFLLLFLIPFWPDPDATGLYNAVCNHSNNTEVLPVSGIIFGLIPCSIIAWKTIQLLLILCSIYLISKNYPLSLLGLVGYFPVFLLTFEDDLLAFPLIYLYWIWIQKDSFDSKSREQQKPLLDWKSFYPNQILHSIYVNVQYRLFPLIAGVLLTFFLGLFVWKGSFLVLGLILSWYITPPLAVVISILYVLSSNFNTWGGSAEVIIGNGFLIGQIGIVFVIIGLYLKKIKWNNLGWLLLGFEILAFFQPKWGEWLIIPLLPFLLPWSKDIWARFIGVWLLVIIIGFTIFTSFPTTGDSLLIQDAVIIQSDGNRLMNDWGVGHYFEYYGGSPSQKGGYAGIQDVNGSYWLGPDINCPILTSSDSLFLERC